MRNVLLAPLLVLRVQLFDGYLDQGGTGLCVASSSCTAGVNYGGSSGDSSLCINGCTATRGAVGLTLSGQSTSWTYTTTGVSCTGGSTATPLPTTVPGTTDCTKVTSLNGGISYDCGKSTSTSAATGVHCSQTASGYSCTGGDSGTKCWTDATGTINCTGKGATEEGACTSTPIKTERSIKTDSTGARTETKVEHLPGGGWVRTDTTFDAAGNKTGETKESGSGVGGAKDGEGNEPGGGAGTERANLLLNRRAVCFQRQTLRFRVFSLRRFLAVPRVVPSPASFTAFGGTYAVSFEPGCQAASFAPRYSDRLLVVPRGSYLSRLRHGGCQMIQILMGILTWARALLPNITGWVLKLFSVGFISQLLAGIGFGVVIYAGLDAGLTAIIGLLQSQWAGVPSAVLQLVTLAGVPQGLNIILSAHVSGLAVVTATGTLKN